MILRFFHFYLPYHYHLLTETKGQENIKLEEKNHYGFEENIFSTHLENCQHFHMSDLVLVGLKFFNSNKNKFHLVQAKIRNKEMDRNEFSKKKYFLVNR